MLDVELGHLNMAADLFKKYEKRDPEAIIGEEIIIPCRFTSQKDYVTKILTSEVDKRLGNNMDYLYKEDLPEDWISYKVQDIVNELGSPSESTIEIVSLQKGRDVVEASDKLCEKQISLIEKGLQKKALAEDTVCPCDMEKIIDEYKETHSQKTTLEEEVYG